jgi:ornithine carbamoyltransferase
MWQRFTERARRIVFYAQEEAGRLAENYVSTEHILLGILRENDSVAARVLDRMNMSMDVIRDRLEKQVTHGDGRLGQDMQLTPRAKRVIDLAYEEARELNNNYIGSEHMLLGLIKERDGLAGRVLIACGLTLEDMRKVVVEMQDPDKTAGSLGPSLKATDGAVTAEFVKATELLRGRSLLSMDDLSGEEILSLLGLADVLAERTRSKTERPHFRFPRTLALIFEKPSLRTRATFDIGMKQLGGHCTILGPQEIGLGTRETVPDVARNLERWVDVIAARVFDHQSLVGLRDNSNIPVINALSDLEHPCQCLADFQALKAKRGSLKGQKLAWIGDGNNVLHSLMIGGAKVGLSVSAAVPEGYDPSPEVVARAREIGSETGATFEVFRKPEDAVKDADAVYTDVWTSMGQEKEMIERVRVFRPYQVNAELMKHAKPDAVFMHCLPAHRGDEVTDEVMDGPQSIVFDQAECRLHAQKAVLLAVLGS